MPTADGSLLIRRSTWLYNLDMAHIDLGPLTGAYIFATTDRRFLTSVRWRVPNSSEINDVSILAATDRRVLFTMKNVERISGDQSETGRGRLGNEPRMNYFPKENLFITIPDTNDKLIIHPFDLRKSLDATGADYLFVVSKPPSRIIERTPLQYQIETLSGSGGVKYKLEDGPPGMSVSETGLVAWPNDSVPPGKKVGVIINITDTSGQDVTHTLEMTVVKDPSTAPGDRPNPQQPQPPDDKPVEKAALN